MESFKKNTAIKKGWFSRILKIIHSFLSLKNYNFKEFEHLSRLK